MSNECRYEEYNKSSSTILKNSEAININIPLSLINNEDAKTIAVFSYLKMHCGINGIVNFTISDIVTWCGSKPNIRAGKINDTYIEALEVLKDYGYIDYLTEVNRSSYIKCRFDSDVYFKESEYSRFVIVYLDELEKILQYEKKDEKGKSITNTTLLLVFLYLKSKIYRRPNTLRPEERNVDGTNNISTDIEKRKKKKPEAYATNFLDIYKDLNISKDTFAKAIEILEVELGLIVSDRAFRIRNEDGDFRTPHTIFANAYKRDGKYLLAAGDKYSRTEIENEAEILKQYYPNYKINKDKRKTKKGGNNG